MNLLLGRLLLLLLLWSGLLAGEAVRVVEGFRLEAVVLSGSRLLAERVRLRFLTVSRRCGSSVLSGNGSGLSLRRGLVRVLGNLIGIFTKEVERAKLHTELFKLGRATCHNDGSILSCALR